MSFDEDWITGGFLNVCYDSSSKNQGLHDLSGSSAFCTKTCFKLCDRSKILLVGQAPGRRAHETKIPWNDPSGDRLREWLDVDRPTFYNPAHFAIVPMGFCYPGTGSSGDLPPRPECSATWMERILQQLKAIRLTIVIGAHAHGYFLKTEDTVTQNVRNWKRSFPKIIPLPHPSPRNNIWLKKNPWFEKELLSHLRQQCHLILRSS